MKKLFLFIIKGMRKHPYVLLSLFIVAFGIHFDYSAKRIIFLSILIPVTLFFFISVVFKSIKETMDKINSEKTTG